MEEQRAVGATVSRRRLLTLSLSAFGVLTAEPLYLLVDTAVVGHLGVTELGGIGIAAAFADLLLLAGAFLEYGTTARAARFFGAGDGAQALEEGVQASWLALVLGVVLLVIGQAVVHPATRALSGGNAAVADQAIQWLRIGLFGQPGILLVLAGNGWLRGVQRTRAPVIVAIAANASSAALCPLLVYGAGLGLRGSAIANVVAQTAAATGLVVLLGRSTARRRPRRDVLVRQLVLGRDLVLRGVGFEVAFLVAAAVCARMGAAQLAAHQIGLQLWNFLALVLDSFAIAAQSLVGAALGAGDAVVARVTAWRVARLGLAAGVAATVVFAAGWFAIPAVFSSSEAVRHQAHLLWPVFLAMLPAAGVVFALDGVLVGAGDAGFMRNVTLLGALGAFVPVCLAALVWHWGVLGVWLGLASFIGVRTVGGVLRVRGDRWATLGS